MIYEINIDLDLEDVARTVNHEIAATPEERCHIFWELGRLLNVYRTRQPEARTIIDVALKGKW